MAKKLTKEERVELVDVALRMVNSGFPKGLLPLLIEAVDLVDETGGDGGMRDVIKRLSPLVAPKPGETVKARQ